MVPIFLFTLIGCCLFVVYGALIDYYRRAWIAIPEFDASGKISHTRISVLIPARNESANITHCIESLLSQSYPKHLFEVIVIDDHSTDGTPGIVMGLHHPDLVLSCIQLNEVTDQQPVRIGDPAPIRRHPRLAASQIPPTRIARSTRPTPRLLSIFQTLDFITLQGITGASVYKKFHSMCNGANLAYEKRAFFEVDGFRGIDAIPSGDDMLLMHKIYNKYPNAVFFLKSPQAIVSTRPQNSWKGFIHQRVRWASKADRYDDKRIFRVLLLVYIVNLMFAVLPIAACWNTWWLSLLVIGLLTKTMLEFIFVYTVAGFFDQQALMRWFPLMQPFHIVYTVIIGWMGKFGSYRWKDRRIRR
jgi:glycosyltransferase involved in cell wall biosynthesis